MPAWCLPLLWLLPDPVTTAGSWRLGNALTIVNFSCIWRKFIDFRLITFITWNYMQIFYNIIFWLIHLNIISKTHYIFQRASFISRHMSGAKISQNISSRGGHEFLSFVRPSFNRFLKRRKKTSTMASSTSTGVTDVFNDYAEYITAEQQIREVQQYVYFRLNQTHANIFPWFDPVDQD